MILVSFVPYFNDRRLGGVNPPNLENYIGFEERGLRGIGWVGGLDRKPLSSQRWPPTHAQQLSRGTYEPEPSTAETAKSAQRTQSQRVAIPQSFSKMVSDACSTTIKRNLRARAFNRRDRQVSAKNTKSHYCPHVFSKMWRLSPIWNHAGTPAQKTNRGGPMAAPIY